MNAPVGQPEQNLIQSNFGTLTTKRVIFYRAKSWFSGGSRQDIPLQHVTSVQIDTARNMGWGLILLIIGLILIVNGGDKAGMGAFSIALAIFLLWGSPVVVVNTAGNDINAAKGYPWHRTEANKFVESLRSQLFKV